MFNINSNKKNSFGLALSKNLDTYIKKPKKLHQEASQ